MLFILSFRAVSFIFGPRNKKKSLFLLHYSLFFVKIKEKYLQSFYGEGTKTYKKTLLKGNMNMKVINKILPYRHNLALNAIHKYLCECRFFPIWAKEIKLIFYFYFQAKNHFGVCWILCLSKMKRVT